MLKVLSVLERTRARPKLLTLVLLLALPLLTGCPKPKEVCDDNADNDGNGQSDCDDAFCSLAPNCQPAGCGNGIVDAGEDCDGANLNNQECTDAGNFGSGDLACNADCSFNTDDCDAVACGDGIANGTEECDGNDLNNNSCVGEGFIGGLLDCNNDCTINTDACVAGANCGNGQVDAGEECDGNDLDGEDCVSQGHLAGTLACLGNCTFDEALCVDAVCGNNIVEPGEECDGVDLDGNDCTDQGFAGGALACNANVCTFNTAGCSDELCGNGIEDDGDGQIDCNDAQCAADPNCDNPTVQNNVVGAGFSGALAVAISNDGTTAFFTAYNAADQAAVFSAPAAGGNATQLAAGAPLDKPTGLALSPDGATLLIADLSSGANELGGIFSLPIAGGTPTAVTVVNVVRPSTIAVADNGTLIIGGADPVTGVTGVYSLAFGGSATLLSALKDPAAVAVAGNQVLAVEAVSENNRSSVVKIPIGGGAPAVLATGLHMDYPAGVSALVGNNTVIFGAVDVNLPNFGSGLFQVSINGGAVTPFDVGNDFISAGSLARSRNNNNFALVDTEAGAGISGAILRLQ